MRIAVVGPTHPIKGGVSQHTTEMAKRLKAAGHDVEIVSWAEQYPKWLYPGEQTVSSPDAPPFDNVSRGLSWKRPDTWVREARRQRSADLVVFAHVTPMQALIYLPMLKVLRRAGTPTALVCHNVLPHERHAMDQAVVRKLFASADLLVTHTEVERSLAGSITTTPVVVAPIPPFLSPVYAGHAPAPGRHDRLIFFGLVRPYKGVDVLLHAMARATHPFRLRIAGEFWGGTGHIEALATTLGLRERVELRAGYVPAEQVPPLFDDVDALVLPYRSATGSQGAWLGFELGVPVIASAVGPLAEQIRDRVDGYLCAPGDAGALAAAIDRFYTGDTPLKFREAVRPVNQLPYWDRYVETLTSAARDRAVAAAAAPPGGVPLAAAKVAAQHVIWGRVRAQRRLAPLAGGAPKLPRPVRPTDVLSTAADAEAAIAECKRLRFPRHPDKPKNWDALGAVSTIVNELGTDVSVLDAGAARYSPVLPWLYLLGARRLVGNNLEFTRTTRHGDVIFEPGDVTRMRFTDGSLDAITCLSVIEHGVPVEPFFDEAARTIRGGGLLVVSTDYDASPPDTAGMEAYGVPIKIFGPDDVRELVAMADKAGFDLIGDLRLFHQERVVHWKRQGLDYTFIRLAFRRRS